MGERIRKPWRKSFRSTFTIPLTGTIRISRGETEIIVSLKLQAFLILTLLLPIPSDKYPFTDFFQEALLKPVPQPAL